VFFSEWVFFSEHSVYLTTKVFATSLDDPHFLVLQFLFHCLAIYKKITNLEIFQNSKKFLPSISNSVLAGIIGRNDENFQLPRWQQPRLRH